MFSFIHYLLFFSIGLSFPLIATAQDTKGNNKHSCTAKHLDADKEVEVNIISSISGNKIAIAQWILGHPTIAIDDSAFAKLPKNARQFVYYHECAHLKLMNKDEHEVDCESIRLLIKHRDYTEMDIRRLIQVLKQEFGWSKRWSKLLNCKNTS
tara:strand:- start:1901 stop:2359 length:459 start_codon:yes stop_codon:yes gene_type:complete